VYEALSETSGSAPASRRIIKVGGKCVHVVRQSDRSLHKTGWMSLRLFAGLLTLTTGLVGGCAAVGHEQREAIPEVRLDERVPVEGASLFMLTRGVDHRKPVLLWLHGGPGAAERPLLRLFSADLERSFVVAYLDQRGAGRSYEPANDQRQLTISRHVADLATVVDLLGRRYPSQPLILAGHSWGAALALLYARDHPKKVSAVVGVAPLISTRAAQRSEYDFVRARAELSRDATALEELSLIGDPPYRNADQVLALERLAQRYGAVFRSPPNKTLTVLRGFVGGHLTPWELPRFIRVNRESLHAMHDELLDLDLSRSVAALEVRVLFSFSAAAIDTSTRCWPQRTWMR
jgi:proline iminopeptidase